MTRVALALALTALALGAAVLVVGRADGPPTPQPTSAPGRPSATAQPSTNARRGARGKLARGLADLLRRLPGVGAPNRPAGPLGVPGHRLDPCFRDGAGPCVPVCRYRTLTHRAGPGVACPAIAPDGCLHLAAARPPRPAAPTAPQAAHADCPPRLHAPPPRAILPTPQP